MKRGEGSLEWELRKAKSRASGHGAHCGNNVANHMFIVQQWSNSKVRVMDTAPADTVLSSPLLVKKMMNVFI